MTAPTQADHRTVFTCMDCGHSFHGDRACKVRTDGRPCLCARS